MKRPAQWRGVALAPTGLLVALAGCAGLTAPPSATTETTATAPKAAQSQTAATGPAATGTRLAGLLTLKGSEPDAWWALTDNAGEVWRLEPADEGQRLQWRQLQNVRVAVTGVRAGTLLRNPIFRVERIDRLR